MAVRWRLFLDQTVHTNGNHNFVQFATVRPDGSAANRTVVIRGAVTGITTSLLSTADARSNKVQELANNPQAEVCWYMPTTRDQFRLSGKAFTVMDLRHGVPYQQDVFSDDGHLIDWERERQQLWNKLSDRMRGSFAGPHPGIPRQQDPSPYIESIALPDSDSPPEQIVIHDRALFNFSLLVLLVERVDYVSFQAYPNQRVLHQRQPNGQWTETTMNV